MTPSNAIARLQQTWESPSYIMMVGVPGVGKSSFIKKFREQHKDLIHVASTDDLLEVEAARMGMTYSDAFLKVSQKVLKRAMEAEIKNAISERKTIFHDQTNMSRKARGSKLAAIPDYYKKICLNFTVDDKILYERLNERARLTGKVIPEFVIKNMFNSYQAPSKAEGFSLIIEVDNN